MAYLGTALHFGSSGNRYDDPYGRYGVLYTAFDLPTALMESLFHGHRWTRTHRQIRLDQVHDRMVRTLTVLDTLTILDLTQRNVMAGHFGLNLAQLSGRNYLHTQRIAAQAHAHEGIDGIVYPSRNNYPDACLALFDRSGDKLGLVADMPLDQHRAWPVFFDDYGLNLKLEP